MGLGDRPYSRSDYRMPGGMGGFQEVIRRMMGLGPAPGPKPWAVKYLIWTNIIVFLAQVFLDQPTDPFPRGMLTTFFAIAPDQWMQAWRCLTFQFLHAGIGHIFWNMLLLFFLGRMVERDMGSKRFLIFYLSCGVAAGIAYVLMGRFVGPVELPPATPLIGASGGVYAVLLACAVRFPHVKLLLAFIFPVSIRVAVAIAFGYIAFRLLSALSTGGTSPEFWSEIAHLGGLIGACIWLWGLPGLMTGTANVGAKVQKGAWERKMKKRVETEKTVDEVLRKIHDKGINSLTEKEKKILADATERQRKDEF
jgi:membrane associated rhomboid family serine protease